MSDDDPFFGAGDGDRTILRPRPGGRRPAPQQQPPPQPQRPAYPGAAQPERGQAYAPPPGAAMPPPAANLGQLGGGVNPLTSAATTLIALIAQLRESAHHPDPRSLFQHVANEIRQFESVARTNGVSPDHVLAARYVLCTALDETVLNTPWGSQSAWASQTLLTTFHNDAWGGEKFFQLLDRMLQEPGANLHLLELMYLLIALGFEGRYRIQDRGRADLERIQDNLYQVIRMQRGDVERNLSPHWQGLKERRSRLAQYVPLWVVASAATGILVLIYFAYSFAVNRASGPVTNQIASLATDLAVVAEDRPDYVPETRVDLRTLLRAELDQGLLDIESDPKGQRIVLSDARAPGGLFRSGSAEINSAVEPLLASIGRALDQVGGKVEVIGHTDNVPMGAFSQYRDNWQLSEARAVTVMTFLADGHVSPERLSSFGMADQDPVRPAPDGQGAEQIRAWRDANRRVEILLHAEATRL